MLLLLCFWAVLWLRDRFYCLVAAGRLNLRDAVWLMKGSFSTKAVPGELLLRPYLGL